MAKITVEHHFDFGSPNSYLAWKVIPEIEKRTGVAFIYVPVLLGGVFKLTGNQPPMIAFGAIKNKPQYDALEMRRFIERHNLVKFKMNAHFPVNTVQIMRGAIVARWMETCLNISTLCSALCGKTRRRWMTRM